MPRRVVVVDGYNLILRSPALKPGEGRTLAQAREKLLNLLGWAVGRGEVEFVVVFDGAEGMAAAATSGRVRVHYSRPPDKADDVIRALVEERVEGGARVTVVTSDLEVARHARAMGADVALGDLFLASAVGGASGGAGEGEEKPARLSRKELDEWARMFRERQAEEE
jgi:predicted RNA-binding protein with PIN domain